MKSFNFWYNRSEEETCDELFIQLLQPNETVRLENQKEDEIIFIYLLEPEKKNAFEYEIMSEEFFM